MRNSRKIVLYTIADIMNHRSVYVAFAVCVLFVLMLRGCYRGPVMINGQPVELATIAGYVSKTAFHLIAGAALMITCLLSMRLLGRDRDDGTIIMLLSRPVGRAEYLAGRMGGLWIVSSLFMLLLHLTVVAISFLKTGDIMAPFMLASLLCCLNVLFMILLVSLLSLLLPDFLAAAIGLLVAVISYLSESTFQVMQSKLVISAMGADAEMPVSLWRSLFPKIAGLQFYASSLIGNEPYQSMGPVPPVISIILYTALLMGLLLWSFRHAEL